MSASSAHGSLVNSVDKPGNVLTVSGQLDISKTHTELHLQDGRVLRLPTATLLQSSAALENGIPGVTPDERDEATRAVPIIEEQLEVSKRTIVTGKVRIDKHVQEYAEALDVPLAQRHYDVERVTLNKPVQVAPAVRQEGETTVYPVIKEQLVLTTQLILAEELRVTKRDTETRDTRTVTLKREVMTVTRENVTSGNPDEHATVSAHVEKSGTD